MFHIAVLVSGGGTNLQTIIDHIQDGKLHNIQITCVVASRPDCHAIERAKKANLPVVVVNRKDHASLEAYDAAMVDALKPFPVDLVVLAGFLALLGPCFVQAYPNRIINIHPSLIPAFCGPGFYGIRPHEAALAYGVKITGATVHLVDKQYDHGPILLQKAVAVLPDDTPQTLQKRVMEEAEQQLLPQAIALFATGRVDVVDGQVIIKKERE